MSFEQYKDKGLSGLANLGNTCFLNSAFQCLSHSYELSNFLDSKKFASLKNNKNKDELDLLKEYDDLRKLMWSENCVVSPGRFVSKVQQVAIKKDRDIFTGFAQNDLPEFLLFIMDVFHDCISRKVTMNVKGNEMHDKDKLAKVCYTMFKSMYEKDYSEIIQLFYGVQVSTIVRKDNNKSLSHTPEPFFLLNLPLPKKRNVTLYECFDLYTETENLDGENKYAFETEVEIDVEVDESGNEIEVEDEEDGSDPHEEEDEKPTRTIKKKVNKTEYIDAKKDMKFFSLPDVLVIDLKRFNDFRSKNNCVVDFPIEEHLDLTKYVIGYNSASYKYELYGICNHSGSTMGGHYTAFVKNANNKWYHYNDTNVSEVKDLKKMKTNKAYCFFYRKKK